MLRPRLVAVPFVLVLSLSGCSGSGLDEPGTTACERAMELRTTGGSIEDRQATMDDAFLQARMSQAQEFKDLTRNADEDAGGVIGFNDLVEVCRGLGFDIPDGQ